MKHILIAGVNWLGDALMLTPAARALKERFPASYIAVMAVERVSSVFEDNPYIDEVIIFDEKKNHRSLSDKFTFIGNLRQKQFDTVFLVHRSLTRALVCCLAGIRERIGYRRRKTAFILTKKISPPVAVHRQDYYLNLFEQSGVACKNRLPQFFLPDTVRKQALALVQSFSGKRQYAIGVHVAANWPPKRWPAAYFAQLCDRLSQDLSAAVILTGTDKDKGLIEEVVGRMRTQPYNLCGKTTTKQLAAVMEQMNCFVSADSGPAHLAAAVGTATLVLFGPTKETMTAPRGRRVVTLRKSQACQIPCYNEACQDNVCMTAISVEDVYQKIKEILMYE